MWPLGNVSTLNNVTLRSVGRRSGDGDYNWNLPLTIAYTADVRNGCSYGKERPCLVSHAVAIIMLM